MYIGVIGQRSCSAEVASIAGKVGTLIAQRGGILVCGGAGGVMEASARGAKEAGGVTIGILPGTSKEEANPYITIPIPTGLGPARNLIVARTSDVLIAITGGYGTLSEIAFALQFEKPVIGLNTWGLMREEKVIDAIINVSSPEEAVARAVECYKNIQCR